MHQATKFEANKFYVMTPPGERWGDYEGPFDSSNEALVFLGRFVNEDHSYSPEMLRMVVVHFNGRQVDLVKDRKGTILNGEYLQKMGLEKRGGYC